MLVREITGKKISKKKMFFWVLPLAISLSFQLYVSNMTAGQGEELARIETQIQLVSRQNQILEEKITERSSLSIIEGRAQSLGLAKPESIIYAETAKGTAQANVILESQ